MVATCGRSGYASSNSFTRSVNFRTLSSLSVVFSVVSSTLPIRNFFTSMVLFSSTLSLMMEATARATSSSLMLVLYSANILSYLFSSIVIIYFVCFYRVYKRFTLRWLKHLDSCIAPFPCFHLCILSVPPDWPYVCVPYS